MFKKTHLSVVFLAGVMLQPANAANVSITTGQADFLLDYTVNGSNGAFQDTFNYYKLGFYASWRLYFWFKRFWSSGNDSARVFRKHP